MKRFGEEDFYVDWQSWVGTFVMYDPHWHPFYEIYYLCEGERNFFIRDTVYKLHKGDAVLVARGDLHRTTFISPKIYERFQINFKECFKEEFCREIGEKRGAQFFQSRLIRIPEEQIGEFEHILERMNMEYRNQKQTGAKALSKLLAKEALIFLMRCVKEGSNRMISEGELENEKERDIQKAVTYIYHNFDKQIPLEEAAAVAGMSEHYFSKKFKRITGFRFKEYLTAVRISQAIELLAETDLPITEIGVRCGFSDGNYFGDVFKKNQGMSPHRYRKQMWEQYREE